MQQGPDIGGEERARGPRPEPEQSEELFKVAFYAIPDLAAIVNLETGCFLEVNDGAERLLGWTRAVIMGRRIADLPIWASRAERARVIRKVEAARDEEIEYDLLSKEGVAHRVAGRVRAVRIGGRRCAVLLLRDVTEQRRADSERALLASLVEHTDDAIIATTPQGVVTAWNRAAEALYGYSAQEALGRPMRELAARDADEGYEALLALVAGGRSVVGLETRRRAKDGAVREVSITLSPIRDAAGRVTGISKIVRDIGERRRLEEGLRRLNAELESRVRERTAALEREIEEHRAARESLGRSEAKYRELVESANSIILRWDTQGRLTFVNRFGQEFFGYSAAELLGRHVVGTIVPAAETGGRDLAGLMAHVSTHPDEHTVSENENVRRDGSRAWIAWTNRPVLDAQGRVVETLSIGNDITPLKTAQRELVRAKEAAESADRLKSAFLATMSHELRTPLNSIIGFTGILLQGLAGPLNEEQARQLGMVQESSRHLHALINDVLDLSKIEAGQLALERAPFDLRASAERVVRELEPLARKKSLALKLQVGPGVGLMVGDRRRVEQVLVNLVGNAIKFTERGEVEVACRAEGPDVVTAVRDTGIGIRREDLALLFRPFQQVDAGLARKHEGTGLGLSICRKLLDLLGGSIEVHSTWGAGSVFTFRLPLVRREGA